MMKPIFALFLLPATAFAAPATRFEVRCDLQQGIAEGGTTDVARVDSLDLLRFEIDLDGAGSGSVQCSEPATEGQGGAHLCGALQMDDSRFVGSYALGRCRSATDSVRRVFQFFVKQESEVDDQVSIYVSQSCRDGHMDSGKVTALFLEEQANELPDSSGPRSSPIECSVMSR